MTAMLNVAARAMLACSGVQGLNIQDVFDIHLYTGNDTSQSISTPFAPDFVWLKSRHPDTFTHGLFDTTRGPTNYLQTPFASSQNTDANTLTAFGGGGYSLGSSISFNHSGDNYVGWAWKKAAKFFDVVTWTGNGTNRTIAHSLGVVPGMILVKKYADGSGSGNQSWQVYHASLANNQYLVVNSTAAVTTGTTRWNSTTATSAVFSIGTDTSVNNTSDTYVAYIFAHDPTGVIQCGSYTGSGSASGMLINLGWEPQWIIIRDITAGGNWFHIDQTRGWTSSTSNYLTPNSINAEADLGAWVSPSANGFTINTSNGILNASGRLYIYCAISKP